MPFALRDAMPRGSKSKYTSKHRQAHHIEESAKKRGASSKRAAKIGYATVNKQDSGGKMTSSGKTSSRGRGRKRTASSVRKGARS